MKKSLITLTVMLAAAAMVVVFCGPAAAKVTGVCSGCHTMHNSQNGDPMAKQLNAAHNGFVDDTTANGTLLVKDCVGCHSHNSAITYDLGGCTVPVVYTRGGAPSTYLSGGNFYWVADEGGDTDAMGHNVLGISVGDTPLSTAPGGTGCSGCHTSLATPLSGADPSLRNGCQGCHLKPRHHADDGTGTKYVDDADDGWYRFLAMHQSGPVMNFGVKGIEHSVWGHNGSVGGTDHNEYLGVPEDKTGGFMTASLTNGTTTAFCCGCHGNFHEQNTVADGSGEWIRHPSDAVIPSTAGSEYASMSASYDPLSPVARSVSAMTGLGNNPSGAANAGADMVMCLSCHRPHGSPYNDLLRWNYGDMQAGTSTSSRGCFYCHTKKNAD